MSTTVAPALVRGERPARAPWLVLAAALWIAAMLVVAVFADRLRPYGITQFDLRNRLAHPGNAAHWLGTDELGRDVLSRLLVSVRISLLIAFGATAMAAVLGTMLGFLAAQLRGWVEQAVLMLIDVQAALPFLILALAVLAFFGNSLPLFVALMGFYGWERHARIARGLAIAADAQGYASAVRQLGASPWRVYGRHILPNIASHADRLGDAVLPRGHPARERPVVLGARHPAADDLARQHDRLRARVPDPCPLDPTLTERRRRAHHLRRQRARRLAARPARPDTRVNSWAPSSK